MKRHVRITGINHYNSDFIHATVRRLKSGLGMVLQEFDLTCVHLLVDTDITSDQSEFGYVPDAEATREALLILATLPLATDVVVTISQD